MFIPKLNPLQMAITDLALPQVKNLADAISDQHISTLPAIDKEKETAEALKKLMDFTRKEMMKELVFFPELEDETDW